MHAQWLEWTWLIPEVIPRRQAGVIEAETEAKKQSEYQDGSNYEDCMSLVRARAVRTMVRNNTTRPIGRDRRTGQL